MTHYQDPEVTKEAVRHAMQALGADGQETSYRQVYEALGLSGEGQQAVVRTRISDMLRHGEVERVKAGVFTYNAKHRPREGKTYGIMWRFVRKAKPVWSVSDCAQMTRVSYTQVLRYVSWLEAEDYIERCGRSEKRAVLYRATGKTFSSPETPYPPGREVDPFEKERIAAATITRLMLCADPYNRKTAQTVVQACRVLLAGNCPMRCCPGARNWRTGWPSLLGSTSKSYSRKGYGALIWASASSVFVRVQK